MDFSHQTKKHMMLLALLTISGGFMDAYSYIGRGRVFANAQTGNILLLGVHLFQGEMNAVPRYLLPVLAFSLGVVISDFFRYTAQKHTHFHWRQLVLASEAVILGCVSFFPQEVNLLANCLTSLACGAQVESFREMEGAGVATTMCIGNLRSAVHYGCDFIFTKNPVSSRRARMYASIIVCFMLGALAGNWMISLIAEKAMLCCCIILTACTVMIGLPSRKQY